MSLALYSVTLTVKILEGIETTELSYIDISVAYLTTMSLDEILWRRIPGRLMNDELERAWKEMAVTYFKIFTRHSPKGNSGK
jgi:hypothetical protein